MVSAVTVTRANHPLTGRVLSVLGRMRRQGQVQLLVVLPDGSKTLMPAVWTDDAAAADPSVSQATVEALDRTGKHDFAAVLAGTDDLLRACRLVEAFARREEAGQGQAARKSPCEEADHAACPVESDPRSGPGATGTSTRVTTTSPGQRSDPGPDPDDRQSGRSADREGRR